MDMDMDMDTWLMGMAACRGGLAKSYQSDTSSRHQKGNPDGAVSARELMTDLGI